MGTKATEKKALNFEEALTSLEEIVNEIESNPLELEELVQRYEKGMKLLNQCRAILDETKKRLIVLNQADLEEKEAQPETNRQNDRNDDLSDFRLS